MNPLLAKKLEELDHLADALRDTLAGTASTVKRQGLEKEDMQQELWRVQRDLAALTRIQEDYDTVADANERYRSQRAQLRSGLERILTHAKALGLEYQE